MSKLNRRMAVAGIVLGVAAMSATPAQAAEKVWDEHYDYEFTMFGIDNPCTPEFDDITLNMTGHAVAKVWEEDGQFVKAQERSQAQLDGQAADGTRYVGTSPYRSSGFVRDGWSHFISDSSTRLISQGSGPNFHLRYTTHSAMNLNGPGWTMEVIRDSAECRG